MVARPRADDAKDGRERRARLALKGRANGLGNRGERRRAGAPARRAGRRVGRQHARKQPRARGHARALERPARPEARARKRAAHGVRARLVVAARRRDEKVRLRGHAPPEARARARDEERDRVARDELDDRKGFVRKRAVGSDALDEGVRRRRASRGGHVGGAGQRTGRRRAGACRRRALRSGA